MNQSAIAAGREIPAPSPILPPFRAARRSRRGRSRRRRGPPGPSAAGVRGTVAAVHQFGGVLEPVAHPVGIQPLRHHSSSARASPQRPTAIRRSLLPASRPSRTARSSPSARRRQLFNVHSGHGPQVLDPAQVLPQVERQRQPQAWYLKQSVSAGVEAAPKGRCHGEGRADVRQLRTLGSRRLPRYPVVRIGQAKVPTHL